MLLPLTLQRDKPLQQQLYTQLRALIESGDLPAGSRMPSTRDFAAHHSVSRMTAVVTYDRLSVEGFLHTVPAGGTFVGTAAPAHLPAPAVAAILPEPGAVLNPILSHDIIQADPALFPAARWRSLLRAALDRRQHCERGVLQATLAKWLAGTRGLAVVPDQIIVMSARQRALDIVAHLLLTPGQAVAFEAPGDEVAAHIWAARGAHMVGVGVDAHGLMPQALPRTPVALLHLTPGCQYPTGAVLPESRRAAVLDWAEASGAHVVEVDRVGDMRYDHDHSPALMAQDRNGRVLYIGDFTSVLGPVVSMAYLVVPRHLVAAAESARRMLDGVAQDIEIGALAEFLESNAYSRHVIGLRRVYAARRASLVAALGHYLGAPQGFGAAAGFALPWPPHPNLGGIAQIAAAARLSRLPVMPFPDLPLVGENICNKLLLFGFSSLPEPEIAARVARMAARLHVPSAGDISLEQAAD